VQRLALVGKDLVPCKEHSWAEIVAAMLGTSGTLMTRTRRKQLFFG